MFCNRCGAQIQPEFPECGDPVLGPNLAAAAGAQSQLQRHWRTLGILWIVVAALWIIAARAGCTVLPTAIPACTTLSGQEEIAVLQ